MATLINVLPYLLAAAMVATVAVLFAGVVSMSRGGNFNARWGNKLMRLRVIMQGVAVLVLGLLFLLSLD